MPWRKQQARSASEWLRLDPGYRAAAGALRRDPWPPLLLIARPQGPGRRPGPADRGRSRACRLANGGRLACRCRAGAAADGLGRSAGAQARHSHFPAPQSAAGSKQDVDLWVRAVPGRRGNVADAGGLDRPHPRGGTAGALAPQRAADRAGRSPEEWAATRIFGSSRCRPAWPRSSAPTAAEPIGRPLTQIFRLEENEAGELPLVAALAARHGFAGQPARARNGDPGGVNPVAERRGDVRSRWQLRRFFRPGDAQSDDGTAHPVGNLRWRFRPGAQRGAALAARPDHRRRRAHRPTAPMVRCAATMRLTPAIFRRRPGTCCRWSIR